MVDESIDWWRKLLLLCCELSSRPLECSSRVLGAGSSSEQPQRHLFVAPGAVVWCGVVWCGVVCVVWGVWCGVGWGWDECRTI